MKAKKSKHALRKSKSGQTLVEYSLVLVTVCVVGIFVLNKLGTAIENVFGNVTNTLDKETLGS